MRRPNDTSLAVWWCWLILLLGTPAPARAAELFHWEQLPPLPDKLGVAGPFAGVSGGALIVAGGANFPERPPWEGGTKVWYDTIHVLPTPNGPWVDGGRLPRPLGYGVSVTTPDGVVCIGGSDANQHYADVFRLHWDGKQITRQTLPELPVPCANMCGAMLGTRIYIAGGIATPTANRTLHGFWSLDLDALDAGWQQHEPWPGPGRMLAVAGVQGGTFYLMSGTDLFPEADGKPVRRYLTDAYSFTPKSGWKRLADLPRAAVAAPSPAPALGQSHLFVFGGDDGTRLGVPPAEHPGFPRDILAYHTITDTWTPMGELPAAPVTLPTVWWNGRLLLPSGEIRPGVRSPDVWSAGVVRRQSSFGGWDYLVLGVYLAAMAGIGLVCSTRQHSTDDFFLAGRRIPWWAAGLSIFGTQLSAITFLAIPSKVFATDWTYYLAQFAIVLVIPLVVYFYLPFYRRLHVTTAYEYLERRFNLAVRLFASAAFCLLQVARMAIVLYLPALALSVCTGLDVVLCILMMGVVATLYTVMGGIEAVIWTDVVQVLVLVGGALLSLVVVAAGVQGGWGGLVEIGRNDSKWHMLDWRWSLTEPVVWVVLFGNVLANLIPYTSDQTVVQRYLTTSDEKQAARSLWINAAITLPVGAIFFAIGTALYAFYKMHPDRLGPTQDVDAIFPWFIAQELPPGASGLVIAAVFAAAMSSLDSSMNSVSTALTTDFFRRLRPAATDRTCFALARWLTLILGVFGTGSALLLTQFDVRSLWDTFMQLLGLLGGSLAGLFALGIFSKRATGGGALFGALVSAGILWLVQRYTPLHFFLYAAIGIVSCFVLGYLASLLLPARAGRAENLTYWTLTPEKDRP